MAYTPAPARRTAQIELVTVRAARDIGDLKVRDIREHDSDGLAGTDSGDDVVVMAECFWFDGPC
jgi:hypothetical protein